MFNCLKVYFVPCFTFKLEIEQHLGCCDLKLSFIFSIEIDRTGNISVGQVVTFQGNLLKCSKRAIQTELWNRTRFLCFEESCQ